MTNQAAYRICVRCIMDTTDPEIVFDEEGVCNHCRQRDRLLATLPQTPQEGQAIFERMVARMREEGRRREYDCLIGISGGVDSSYLVYLARQHGLRPLAVHFDNGWNSELAVQNIEMLVSRLGIDLETHVVDWGEFRDLQRSFLKAGVLDLELLSDHGIMATLFRSARRHRIRYLLNGYNVMTETHLPLAWTWLKQDARNIRAIQRRFGTRPIRTFPLLGILGYTLRQMVFRYRFVWPLNLVPYDKPAALDLLRRELGWRDYGVKHGESIITRFYQGYILPVKFGIDKRRSHLSALVCAGAMTREAALRELETPYYTPAALEEDILYVSKKLGFSREEFDELMRAPARSHLDYPSEYRLYRRLRWLKRRIYGERLGVVEF